MTHEHDWYSPDLETVACRHCGTDYPTNPDADERYCPAALRLPTVDEVINEKRELLRDHKHLVDEALEQWTQPNPDRK